MLNPQGLFVHYAMEVEEIKKEGLISRRDTDHIVITCPFSSCGQVFLDYNKFLTHFNKHEDFKKVVCPYPDCPTRVGSFQSVVKHLLCSHGLGEADPLSCTVPGCDYVSPISIEDLIQNHFPEVHPEKGEIEKNNTHPCLAILRIRLKKQRKQQRMAQGH